jgi:hypothetical protein
MLKEEAKENKQKIDHVPNVLLWQSIQGIQGRKTFQNINDDETLLNFIKHPSRKGKGGTTRKD